MPGDIPSTPVSLPTSIFYLFLIVWNPVLSGYRREKLGDLTRFRKAVFEMFSHICYFCTLLTLPVSGMWDPCSHEKTFHIDQICSSV